MVSGGNFQGKDMVYRLWTLRQVLNQKISILILFPEVATATSLPGLFSTKRTEYRLWCLEMWKAAITSFPFFFFLVTGKDSKLEATPRWEKNDEGVER